MDKLDLDALAKTLYGGPGFVNMPTWEELDATDAGRFLIYAEKAAAWFAARPGAGSPDLPPANLREAAQKVYAALEAGQSRSPKAQAPIYSDGFSGLMRLESAAASIPLLPSQPAPSVDLRGLEKAAPFLAHAIWTAIGAYRHYETGDFNARQARDYQEDLRRAINDLEVQVEAFGQILRAALSPRGEPGAGGLRDAVEILELVRDRAQLLVDLKNSGHMLSEFIVEKMNEALSLLGGGAGGKEGGAGTAPAFEALVVHLEAAITSGRVTEIELTSDLMDLIAEARRCLILPAAGAEEGSGPLPGTVDVADYLKGMKSREKFKSGDGAGSPGGSPEASPLSGWTKERPTESGWYMVRGPGFRMCTNILEIGGEVWPSTGWDIFDGCEWCEVQWPAEAAPERASPPSGDRREPAPTPDPGAEAGMFDATPYLIPPPIDPVYPGVVEPGAGPTLEAGQ